jgi:hypothetical protein
MCAALTGAMVAFSAAEMAAAHGEMCAGRAGIAAAG